MSSATTVTAGRRPLVLGSLLAAVSLVIGLIGLFAARDIGARDAARVDDERAASAVAILDAAVTRSARGLASLLSLLDEPGEESAAEFERFARATVGNEDFTPTLRVSLVEGPGGPVRIDRAVMTGTDATLLGARLAARDPLARLIREGGVAFDIGASTPTELRGRHGVWFVGPYPSRAAQVTRRYVAAFVPSERLFAHQRGAHAGVDGRPIEGRRPNPDHDITRSFEAHGRRWSLALGPAPRPFGSRALPWTLLAVMSLLAAATALATSRVLQGQAFARARSEQQLRVLEAAAEERGRLARDLHDSVSQALFSMTLQARAAQVGLEREAVPSDGIVARAVNELGELTRAALAEIRALIFELRPQALGQEGFVAALEHHATALSARERQRITVSGPAHRVVLPQRTEEHVFRLALEAVHNAVRHAEADRIDVRVWLPAEDRLRIEVCDDGGGFDPNAPVPGHIGLETMRERAEQVGGQLRIRSEPGAGTTVTVDVPLES